MPVLEGGEEAAAIRCWENVQSDAESHEKWRTKKIKELAMF